MSQLPPAPESIPAAPKGLFLFGTDGNVYTIADPSQLIEVNVENIEFTPLDPSGEFADVTGHDMRSVIRVCLGMAMVVSSANLAFGKSGGGSYAGSGSRDSASGSATPKVSYVASSSRSTSSQVTSSSRTSTSTHVTTAGKTAPTSVRPHVCLTPAPTIHTGGTTTVKPHACLTVAPGHVTPRPSHPTPGHVTPTRVVRSTQVVNTYTKNVRVYTQRVETRRTYTRDRIRLVFADRGARQIVVNKLVLVRHAHPYFYRHLHVYYGGRYVPFADVCGEMAYNADTREYLADDHQAAGLSRMMYSDYLMNEAQLVRGPDGQFIPLAVAIAANQDNPGSFDADALNRAADSYQQMKGAYDSDDGAGFAAASEAFTQAVAAVNTEAPAADPAE